MVDGTGRSRRRPERVPRPGCLRRLVTQTIAGRKIGTDTETDAPKLNLALRENLKNKARDFIGFLVKGGLPNRVRADAALRVRRETL